MHGKGGAGEGEPTGVNINDLRGGGNLNDSSGGGSHEQSDSEKK